MENLLHEIAVKFANDPGLVGEAIQRAIGEQQSPVRGLLEASLVEEIPFLHSLAKRLGMPWHEEVAERLPETVLNLFSPTLAIQHHLLPVSLGEGKCGVLTYDPFNLVARQMVGQAVKRPTRWCLAPRKKILLALKSYYGVGAETFEAIMEGREGASFNLESSSEVNRLDVGSEEASVIGFVNQIMKEALMERATDIHLEPLEADFRVRYRIDGLLREVPVPNKIKLLQASLISRIKIMAHLDIAERRVPQDGRLTLEMDGLVVDVRVATIPTLNGESISLRLLQRQKFEFTMLGMPLTLEKSIRHLLEQPNGIVLVTGPTGCGKSTTLYTFLSLLNTMERRIVTVEDPVEYKLPGVMQIAVRPEIDLTFSKVLRSILRGDPNVLMVGEMRDLETAEIAIRAALTGHLVFSTLHTNDAVGGITRLIDMGVPPFLVSSSVRAFLAQRLVRLLCRHCSQPGEYSKEFLEKVGYPLEDASEIRVATGCEECRRTGYQGRAALFEVCVITPTLQDYLTKVHSAEMLRQKAIQEGMVPLRQDGWRRVRAGETTIEEVLRVTTSDVHMFDE